MKKFLLFLIIIMAFSLRLFRVNFPIADWHSWRQADTSAVSRNFIKYGFDLLHPRFDDLSNVASGKENPEGYRFVEFPVYNFLQAFFYKTFSFFSLEVWGRLLSVLCSIGSLVFIFLIANIFLGFWPAIFSAFFFAILPFNIFYNRVILPEPMMVFTGLGMLYFFIRWIEDKSIIFAIIGVIFGAVSLLLKPFVAVLFVPICYLAWTKWGVFVRDRTTLGKNLVKWLTFLVFGFLAFLPLIWWRRWMGNYPEGIPANSWLLNDGGIRFKGAWFYWLFAERIGRLILGYWGLIFFGIGLIIRSAKKEGWFFYSWLMGILIYFVIVAAGNVRHDYYQILAIPIITIFLGKGLNFLVNPTDGFNKITTRIFALIFLIFSLGFSWYYVRDFFNINNVQIVEAGRAADSLLPKDAKVIAPYGGDTAFLYQTNRRGWPVGIEINKMIKLGAQYYININFGDETKWLMESYCVVAKTSQWIIIDLRKHCL